MLEKKGDRKRYRWQVFVDDKETILDKIDSVTYVLHPTFPNPVREVSDRKSKFALETTGWGSFDIRIMIRYKDGKEEEEWYSLDLSKGWPSEAVAKR